jgi:beta-aspartyl-peptidase (threonine type)
MRTLWFALAVVLLSQLAFGQTANPEAAIRQILQAQVDAWNRADLEGFMKGYWRSPDLTFFSGAIEKDGWQQTLERYRNEYQAAGEQMGRLEFEDLRVEMLGAQSAFVRGKFHLTSSNGRQPHGLFTLIFRQFPEGWRIIHDHTSGE